MIPLCVYRAHAVCLPRYGPSPNPLPRKVVERGITKMAALELHPPKFRVHLLVPAVISRSSPPKMVAVSSTDKVGDVMQTFAETISKEKAAGRYRVWRVASTVTPDNMLVAADIVRTHGAILLERTDERTVEGEFVESDESFVVEFTQSDQWVVDTSQVPSPSSARSLPPPPPPPPTQNAPLFKSGSDFFSQFSQKTSPAVGATSNSSFKSGAVVAVNKSGPSARPKVQQEPGTMGLGNMGNTCFMNSAIQCLVHTPELAEYFLTGVFQEELNPDNPLGMHGQVAQAFGALLMRLWDRESTMSSYTPREFKQTLQRFAPQFSGYQQHDSQELIAFLLDGLHEDLNRVLKKPYVEKPDWEGGGNKELVEFANVSWEGHMKRNDSVVVDLFQGQLRSTLVCPECEKVSITFDPFMYFTLPLPVQKKWSHDILYIPWDLEKRHLKIPIEINRDSSFKDVRQLLGRWMDATPDNLLTLEIFSHRFYKNLDDNIMVDEMSDNDVIVCFELPCHAQQSRTYKPQSGDPFIVPVFATESSPSRPSYSRGPNLFGFPFITVITQEQAKDPEAMYDAVADRLQRWTEHARHLYSWVAGRSDDMEPVHIPISGQPIKDAVTEFREGGEVVTLEEEEVPEEGDIVDEKATVVQQADEDANMETHDGGPRNTGFKRDLFRLRLQKGNQPYGIGYNNYAMSPGRYETWEQRAAGAKDGVLLQPADVFFAEFDDPVKSYYFGDDRSQYEYARWNHFEEFVHPELAASRKAASTQKQKGLTLQDCLDEFTREEKLGEDDLWYCPRCKKHQQATKGMDLWKVPDILIVHLKRFSNSRMLRDKIDTFVDFPIEGLDLSSMVGERSVGKRLQEEGVDVEALGLHDLDEPLMYDLFAVDEHLGGLGGGHYRAYAMNHVTGKWYHFDDSHVTPSRPEAAVNSNAYLLFYRRRTSRPLGGKSHEKVELARTRPKTEIEVTAHEEVQLPTPPSEGSVSRGEPSISSVPPTILEWPTPNSMVPSSPSSPPPPLESLPPSFDDALYDPILQSDGLTGLPSTQLEFPDPSSRGSPSSIDAEPDDDNDGPFYQPDLDESMEYSQDSLRLRKAKFPGDESLDEDEGLDDGTDVLMTPAESELDENESASSR
ncbi:cysteine proteinase [Lentinus tigrinus ALCF2SS1-7]|uniref:cysteine proteinase n=1 Tax=Lentinus tigrinus ALCF2SS1-7 TaxID=1328758 RepID=UPI001165E362|nr:cysteine proteinase [Lentinus tigrinus ALCF2SS1-7]